MLGIARSGAIGTIRDVEVCFTKLTSPILRELTDESEEVLLSLASSHVIRYYQAAWGQTPGGAFEGFKGITV